MTLPHLVVLAAVGCSGRLTGGMGEERVEITTSNRLSLNRLSLNRLSLNALSAGALHDGAAALAQSEDGRELLVYVARCALDPGQSLVVDGSAYPGLIGLAPEWYDGFCDDSCQHWISACLLAHVNAKGVSVPISLRGGSSSLAPALPPEQAAYPVEEAGFYGNVFTAGEEPLEMYACLGRGLEEGSDSRYLEDRLCASTDRCGFTHTGICAPPPGTSWVPGDAASACLDEGTPETGYFVCSAPPGPGDPIDVDTTVQVGSGGTIGTTSTTGAVDNLWFEVITVYLKE